MGDALAQLADRDWLAIIIHRVGMAVAEIQDPRNEQVDHALIRFDELMSTLEWMIVPDHRTSNLIDGLTTWHDFAKVGIVKDRLRSMIEKLAGDLARDPVH